MFEYMFMPYRRYFDFSGRSSRSEYWYFMLLFVTVIIIAYAMMFASGALEPGFDPDVNDPGALFYVGTFGFGIFAVASLIPAIAVEVRRWHDQEKSGWFWFIRFIPLVGGIIVLVFMCMAGTTGSNKYGTDPHDKHNSKVFS